MRAFKLISPGPGHKQYGPGFLLRRRNFFKDVTYIRIRNKTFFPVILFPVTEGIFMIRSSAILFMVLTLLISFPGKAQITTQDKNEKKQNEETSRFNKLIDDFIERIEREILWQIGNEAYEDVAPDTSKMRITFDSRQGAIHFTGDVVIDQRDRIDGNVVVRNGSITVHGQIEGDVLVLHGNAIIRDEGKVIGNVTAVNGEVRNLGGEITGQIEEQKEVEVDIVYKERRPVQRVPYRISNTFQEDLAVRDIELSPFWLGFNRVEGFSLHAGSGKRLYWDGSIALSLYGQLGYAFKAHRWRGQLGATRQFVAGNDGLIEIGGEVYSLTDTKDEWVVGRSENDLAAFFFHRDYRDYYDREGFSLYSGYYLNSPRFSTHIRVQYLNEIHSGMRNRTDWALFVRDRSFRFNPEIDEGRLNAVRVAFNLSSVKPSPRQLDGWSLLAATEYSSLSLNSDFDYTQYILDVRRYQPISTYDNFNVRFRAGSSTGDLPVQRIYELGGLGTLPAYPHKMFFGNRMLLLNAEYIVRGDILSQLAFVPRGLFGGLTLLFFFDTGWTGIAEQSAGVFERFDDFSFNKLNTSIGFGLGSRNGNTRLGFAWRTDRTSSAVVFVRVERPF